jgi:hypothetical protein
MALIISGHPRSGTTLLQQLCDDHPALGVTNELGNFTHLDRSYLAYARHLLTAGGGCRAVGPLMWPMLATRRRCEPTICALFCAI